MDESAVKDLIDSMSLVSYDEMDARLEALRCDMQTEIDNLREELEG